jgi:hypothetical protein
LLRADGGPVAPNNRVFDSVGEMPEAVPKRFGDNRLSRATSSASSTGPAYAPTNSGANRPSRNTIRK